MGKYSLIANKNYMLFFIGQFVSKLGDGIYMLGLTWMMHVLTNSTLWMSVTLAAGIIPRVVLGPLLGALADRARKKRLLISTDAVRLGLMGLVTVLTFTHHAKPWTLIVFSFLLSTMTGLFNPAVVVFQKRLVEKEQLLEANALQNISTNVSLVLGPALAGFLIGTMGLSVSFLLDSATFGISILSLIFVRSAEDQKATDKPSARKLFAEIRDGGRILAGNTRLRALTPFMLLYSFPIVGIDNLLIVQYIANVLHRGTVAIGAANAAIGVGEILSGILLPRLAKKWTSDRALMGHMMVSAVCVAIIGLTHSMVAICALFAIAGIFMSIVNVSFFTDVQASVPEDALGRVFALLSAMFQGIAPPAQLLCGALGAFIPTGSFITGLGCVAALSGASALVHPSLKNRSSDSEMADGLSNDALNEEVVQ